MTRITTLAVLMGALAVVMAACSSGASDPAPGPVATSTAPPTSTSVPTVVPATAAPTSTSVPTVVPKIPDVVPEDAEIDPKSEMYIGIDLHRQLWATRPSNNYKFGFQWNIGEYAYQRARVMVYVIKGEIDEVRWADGAVKTDGTEPAGLEIPDEPDINDYYSIDGLFGLILEAFDSGPASVSLGFDSIFGFPTLAVIEFAPGSDHEDVSFIAAQPAPIPGPPE